VVALVATPPVVVVMLVTAAVRAVVELGERPAPVLVDGRPGPVVSATARITWSPLLARLPQGEAARPVD